MLDFLYETGKQRLVTRLPGVRSGTTKIIELTTFTVIKCIKTGLDRH